MPPFPKPAFRYDYRLEDEITALKVYRDEREGRAIPSKSSERLLVATWNVANLGVQERRATDYRLIAEIVSWFDLMALQEVNDDITGLRGIQCHLPSSYRALFSDYSGNKERLAFIYDSTKITLCEKVGEIAVPPSDHRHISMPGISQRYRGFDRNPYFASFSAGALVFVAVEVHLYFGSDSTRAVNRRTLEAYAVARWADLRRKSKNAYTRDIMVMGDFNLPMASPGDPVYDALKRRGLHVPAHSSRIASSIKSDSDYDQVTFFPGEIGQRIHAGPGVFDFDGALFRELWETRRRDDFIAYMQYYISDHRVLWVELEL
jgi:endonuclease/exonuclease/phosphatase family metal-dependent hydrolase